MLRSQFAIFLLRQLKRGDWVLRRISGCVLTWSSETHRLSAIFHSLCLLFFHVQFKGLFEVFTGESCKEILGFSQDLFSYRLERWPIRITGVEIKWKKTVWRTSGLLICCSTRTTPWTGRFLFSGGEIFHVLCYERKTCILLAYRICVIAGWRIRMQFPRQVRDSRHTLNRHSNRWYNEMLVPVRTSVDLRRCNE